LDENKKLAEQKAQIKFIEFVESRAVKISAESFGELFVGDYSWLQQANDWMEKEAVKTQKHEAFNLDSYYQKES